MNRLTIVMYHYVRRLRGSRWPTLKALDEDEFVGQLQYLTRFYQFVSLDACLEALQGTTELPPQAALLTFDDGYSDHYQTVFPLLRKQGISGLFFPPGMSLLERKLLWVNKFHLVLARVTNPEQLLQSLFACMAKARQRHDFPSDEELVRGFQSTHRFDPREIALAKRLVQTVLPREVRHDVIQGLFELYVNEDERTLADEFYMSLEQAREMKAAGMMFGSHGWRHDHLTTMSEAEQEADLKSSFEVLSAIGVERDRWSVCYPYGSFSPATLSIAERLGFRMGFTTQVALADLTPGNSYLLPRLDTRDLPVNGTSAPNSWTRLVIEMADTKAQAGT